MQFLTKFLTPNHADCVLKKHGGLYGKTQTVQKMPANFWVEQNSLQRYKKKQPNLRLTVSYLPLKQSDTATLKHAEDYRTVQYTHQHVQNHKYNGDVLPYGPGPYHHWQ